MTEREKFEEYLKEKTRNGLIDFKFSIDLDSIAKKHGGKVVWMPPKWDAHGNLTSLPFETVDWGTTFFDHEQVTEDLCAEFNRAFKAIDAAKAEPFSFNDGRWKEDRITKSGETFAKLYGEKEPTETEADIHELDEEDEDTRI